MSAPVVVLGAGGKLGKLLSGAWPGEVVQYSRADLNIAHADALCAALQGARAVFCFAGVTHGTDRPMSLNISLAQATLDAATDVRCGRVFLMSSAAVYGRQTGLLSETTPTMPLSDYATSKHAMEQMAATHAHPNTVLRLGNVAGADAILGGWRPGFGLDVLGDGTTPQRSYIGPRTLARVLYTLATADGLPPLLNVATPGTLEMGALLDAAGLPWSPRTPQGEIIAKVALDTALLSSFTNWQPDDSSAAKMVREYQEVTAQT